MSALPTIENITDNNQQMPASPGKHIQFWLPKLKDPAEREHMERQSACYQIPRQCGLKRDRGATVLEKGLSLEERTTENIKPDPIFPLIAENTMGFNENKRQFIQEP